MTPPSASRDGADGAVRVVRAVLLAAVTVAFSAGSHVMAGGAAPSATGIVLLGSCTLAVTSLLARRRLDPWTLLPVLVGLQSMLHLGFQTLTRPAGSTAGVAPAGSPHGGLAGHGGHGGHAGLDLPAGTQVLLGDTAPVVAHPHGHVAMLLAHLVAVVAITVLAVGADRALGRTVWRVSRLIRGILRPLPVADGRPGLVLTDVDALPRTSLWVLASRPRRGPPAVLGAA